MSDYNSPDDLALLGAVGRLTLSWGHLDFGLDSMVEILYHAGHGKAIELEMPRALPEKISFLRAIIKTLSVDQDEIRGYSTLLDQIQSAARSRQDIIHGIILEQVERNGETKMVGSFGDTRLVRRRATKVTTKSILEAERDASMLSGRVSQWVDQAHDLIEELAQQRDQEWPT